MNYYDFKYVQFILDKQISKHFELMRIYYETVFSNNQENVGLVGVWCVAIVSC